jgi:20S proteasome alpha/beta subunit
LARAIPFHGKISAVDQKAKTFTIAGKEKSRVFKITDKTVVTKAGAPATMKDVVANEEVRGSYWKMTDGTLEAKTVKLGPKTEAEKTADEMHKKKSSKSETSPEASPSASPKP